MLPLPRAATPRRLLLAVASSAAASVLAACSRRPDQVVTSRAPESAPTGAPARFTIRPDDYHVPYAGTAQDGRRFFLSDELFEPGRDKTFAGLFLWHPDGTFDRVEVREIGRPEGLPPGQAGPGRSPFPAVAELLEPLGRYVLEPITVAPFVTRVDGVEFGWKYEVFEGLASIHVEPGDFIAYYAPWDGVEYDT